MRLECKMLTKSLDFYKRAFDHLPWPVWIRRDHELLYCNPVCANLLDFEKFEGAPLTASMLSQEFLASTQPKAIILNGERRLYHFQEKEFTAEIKMGFGEDLTKVYAQEKKLQNHLASYREVLNSLSAGVTIYDGEQNMRYFNQAYMKMFDFDENWLNKDPYIGEVLDDLRARRLLTEYADYNAYKQEQIKALKSLIDPIETLNHLPDGRIIRIISSPHPMGGSFYIFEDLTDRLNLEAKYNTQLAVYNATLDNLFEGVAVFGIDNRLQFSNKAFAKLWNIDPLMMRKGERLSLLADQAKHLLDPKKDWEQYKNRVMEIVTDRRPKKRKIHRQDGSTIEFSYVPLPDGSNLMSYYDVTDHTKLETALEERKIAQKNADRLKSDFISKMSYEMRTPLNAIIGYSELLSKEYAGKLNHQQKVYCSDILTSSTRLLSLVNNILDLAMIESGHIQLKRESCDFWALFDETLQNYNRQCDPLSGTLKTTIPLEKAIIQGDKKHLKQALETLFMQVTSDIECNNDVTFTMQQDEKSVIVEMTLPVYSKKNPKKAQDDPNTILMRHLAPGKTLGISLARHIIEAHGASLEHITSNPEETQIKLSFPLSQVGKIPLRAIGNA
ncbi:MAG: PAS domain-containing protein [Alphaproteobacteria bacterium]|nr:PAS domain-containing protein [Alphaproteobacteria bacterium]NCQ66358.1 PAS domain-containing protein [Alphaproteobacteria bacterium]NCT06844.1 PAS domain-containing protein [Alphaproteobacteria bacterium]